MSKPFGYRFVGVGIAEANSAINEGPRAKWMKVLPVARKLVWVVMGPHKVFVGKEFHSEIENSRMFVIP